VTTNNRPQEGATVMQNIQTLSHRLAVALINDGNEVLSIDVYFLANALGWAMNLKGEVAQTMRDVATALRDGQQVPLFADGEDGARAADQLADSHQHDVDRLAAISELLWDRTSSVLLVTESEDAE